MWWLIGAGVLYSVAKSGAKEGIKEALYTPSVTPIPEKMITLSQEFAIHPLLIIFSIILIIICFCLLIWMVIHSDEKEALEVLK